MHPEDNRYKAFIGKECVVPMSGRRIKIIADEYVDREFGTGALKITPGELESIWACEILTSASIPAFFPPWMVHDP